MRGGNDISSMKMLSEKNKDESSAAKSLMRGDLSVHSGKSPSAVKGMETPANQTTNWMQSLREQCEHMKARCRTGDCCGMRDAYMVCVGTGTASSALLTA